MPSPQQTEPSSSPTRRGQTDGKDGPYILYAEDNVTDAAFFSRCLRLTDPTIRCVHQENGSLTRDYLLHCINEGADLPTIVVLDIKMPGMSGLDVLEFIRKSDELGHLPVLILSASSEDRDLRRAYRYHANAYLVKPERYNKLKELVEAILVFWLQYNTTYP